MFVRFGCIESLDDYSSVETIGCNDSSAGLKTTVEEDDVALKDSAEFDAGDDMEKPRLPPRRPTGANPLRPLMVPGALLALNICSICRSLFIY